MSLALLLNAPRITGAYCATVDPDIWWTDRDAGLARHLCLSHCPALAECRRTALTWVAPLSVAAGVQWVADRRADPPVRIKAEQVMPTSCDACRLAAATITAALMPEPPPADIPRRRRKKSVEDVYAADLRRLDALAAS